MFCQICGSKLRKTARFCNQCGNAVEQRFGSAVLPIQAAPQPELTSTPAAKQQEPTQRELPALPVPPVFPRQKTGSVATPATQEGKAHSPTDQIAQRSTGRQPQAKSTTENTAPQLPNAPVTNPATIVEIAVPKFPKLKDSDSPNSGMLAPPSLSQTAVPPASTGQTVALKPTEQLEQEAQAKPFFTTTLTPLSDNRQHRQLMYAVPLVLLLAILVFVLAVFATR